MKKLLSIIICALYINMISLPAFASKQIPVEVKSGLKIPITIQSYKTSKSIAAGEKITAEVQKDIIINNTVVFPKGSRATLSVADAKKAGFMGNPGELLIINGSVYDANMDEHRLEYSAKITGEEKTWPKVMVGISIFLLFPLAFFGFVKGGEAKIVQNLTIDTTMYENFKFIPNN